VSNRETICRQDVFQETGSATEALAYEEPEFTQFPGFAGLRARSCSAGMLYQLKIALTYADGKSQISITNYQLSFMPAPKDDGNRVITQCATLFRGCAALPRG
jgi:hypothetical protein